MRGGSLELEEDVIKLLFRMVFLQNSDHSPFDIL